MIEIATLLWFAIGLGLGLILYMIYKKWKNHRYEVAKEEVFAFVKSYKRQCTENNRFVVTVTELQNIFREYDTKLLERIHLDLINDRIIEQHPMDNEWCIRG